jgi:hypothetical protein
VWSLEPLLCRSREEEMAALGVGPATCAPAVSPAPSAAARATLSGAGRALRYLLMMHEAEEGWGCHAQLRASLQHFAPARSAVYGAGALSWLLVTCAADGTCVGWRAAVGARVFQVPPPPPPSY